LPRVPVVILAFTPIIKKKILVKNQKLMLIKKLITTMNYTPIIVWSYEKKW